MRKMNNSYIVINIAMSVLFVLLTILFIDRQPLNGTVYAQADSARLSGWIVDEGKLPIVGATVQLTRIDTQKTYIASTDQNGKFTFVSLPASQYKLVIEKQGFAKASIDSITLNVGDQMSVKTIEIKVGDVRDSVTITDTSLIREDAAVGTVVDRNFVASLPLNGRSFISLIAGTPGVVLTNASSSEAGQFSVNGQRANANYFSIDGASGNAGISPTFNLGQSAGGALPGLGVLGSTSNLISIDALQEFAVLTSTYSPEYGRSPGAQVLMVTRPGNNTLTGSLYNYFRNDILDANDWFANANNARKPMMRNNNFGGILGGPIVKDKTFYFFSYEGVRLRQPRFAITDVPSLSLRESPEVSKEIKQFLNAYPKPNRDDIGNGTSEFVSSYSNPTSMNATSLRMDQILTDSISLFGRYNYAPSRMNLRGASATSLNTISSISANTNTLTVGANITHSARINSDWRFNYSRFSTSYSNRLDDFGNAVPVPDSDMFIKPYIPANSQTLFFVDGVRYGSLASGSVTDNLQRQINVIGNISISAEKHALKFGVDYRKLSPFMGVRQLDQLAYFAGFAGADEIPDYGTVKSGISLFSALTASDSNTLFITNWSVYALDTWRFSPKLTMTYGFRWEINPSPVGEKQLPVAKNIDKLDKLSMDFSGASIYKTRFNNIAPRIGLSYLLSEKQGKETVLRGGFGIFYDLGSGNIGSILGAFPYTRISYLFGSEFPLPASLAIVPPFTTDPPYTTSRLYDPNLLAPRTYQWNFTVEQSLGRNQTLKSAYIGAIARKLLRQEQQYLPNNPLFDPFATVSITKSSSTSDYHALQLYFQRRLHKGLQAMVSYTFSKSLDNISNDSSDNLPFGSTDMSLDRGHSDFDIRHQTSTALTYQIPGRFNISPIKQLMQNWQLESIVMTRSSTPFNIRYFKDLPGIGYALARPDLVPGESFFVQDPLAPGGKSLNESAFTRVTEDRQGTLGRNVVRGSSAWQVNFGLRRQFNLTEKLNLMFGAQAFNLFNHPNFSNPDGYMDSTSFGKVTMLGNALSGGSFGGGLNSLYQFGGPRSMQLFLKLNF